MSNFAVENGTQGIDIAKSVVEEPASSEDGSPRSSASSSMARDISIRRRKRQNPDTSTDSDDESGNMTESKLPRKRQLNPAYKILFRETLQNITTSGDDTTQRPQTSFVGASLWTRKEKEAFFRGLSLYGVDNLPALARCIPAKNELQVRQYLVALQQGVSSEELVDSDSAPMTQAAFDIPPRTERLFDSAADVLAQRSYQEEIAEEQINFAHDIWLINDENLEQLECGNHSPDDDFWNPEISPSLQFLQAETFIELSRTLFMNGPPGTESNWQDMDLLNASRELSSPGIFHSAFNELYQITQDLTRRLVSAALIQATSRLRSRDDDRHHPKPEISLADVETACDILGLERNGRKYWAHVARRCGVAVYTNSKKVSKDGRESTKNGVRLSYNEVEIEMGFPSNVASAEKNQKAEDGETSRPQNESLSGRNAHHDSDAPFADPDSEGETLSSPSPTSLSSSSVHSDSDNDTDSQLEFLDQQASQAEDRRVLEWLRRDPDPVAERLEQENEEKRIDSKLDRLKRPRKLPDSDIPWRKRLRYEAEWEAYPAFTSIALSEEGDDAIPQSTKPRTDFK